MGSKKMWSSIGSGIGNVIAPVIGGAAVGAAINGKEGAKAGALGGISNIAMMPGLGDAVMAYKGYQDDKKEKNSNPTLGTVSDGNNVEKTEETAGTAEGGEDIYSSGAMAMRKKKSTLIGSGDSTFSLTLGG